MHICLLCIVKENGKFVLLVKLLLVQSRSSSHHHHVFSTTESIWQTRSLTSIRACIARCNRSEVPSRKRPAKIRPLSHHWNGFDQFRVTPPTTSSIDWRNFFTPSAENSTSKLKTWIEKKVQENATSFIEEFYRLVMEIFYSRANVILPLGKNLHRTKSRWKSWWNISTINRRNSRRIFWPNWNNRSRSNWNRKHSSSSVWRFSSKQKIFLDARDFQIERFFFDIKHRLT